MPRLVLYCLKVLLAEQRSSLVSHSQRHSMLPFYEYNCLHGSAVVIPCMAGLESFEELSSSQPDKPTDFPSHATPKSVRSAVKLTTSMASSRSPRQGLSFASQCSVL